MLIEGAPNSNDIQNARDSSSNNQQLRVNLERLDHQWVVRWLDDVGLPQYKDRFLEARVDGRVLRLLTIDDLLVGLRVSNQLHHLSLKWGIQVCLIKDLDDTRYTPQFSVNLLDISAVPNPHYPLLAQNGQYNHIINIHNCIIRSRIFQRVLQLPQPSQIDLISTKAHKEAFSAFKQPIIKTGIASLPL